MWIKMKTEKEIIEKLNKQTEALDNEDRPLWFIYGQAQNTMLKWVLESEREWA